MIDFEYFYRDFRFPDLMKVSGIGRQSKRANKQQKRQAMPRMNIVGVNPVRPPFAAMMQRKKRRKMFLS